MKEEIQATFDICIKIATFQNLSDMYLRNIYYTLHLFIDEQTYAFPYQIINNFKQTKSNISLTNYISPIVSFSPFSSINLDEMVIFKILLPISLIQQSNLRCKVILYEFVQQKQQLIEQIYLQYESIFGLHSLMPVLFQKQKISINAVISTQLLTYRINNSMSLSQVNIDKIIKMSMIQYSKQKSKLKTSKESIIQELNPDFFQKIQKLRQKYKYRIFNQHFQMQKKNEFTQFTHLFIVEMKNVLQINWKHIIELISLEPIQKIMATFYTTLKLQLKENVYQKCNNKSQPIIEGLKMGKIDLDIQTIFKKQASAFHKGDINDEKHYVVLVHGYGATRMVFYELECLIRYFYPHIIIINSKINENRTEDNLQDLGKRLAFEITQYMKNNNEKQNFALSFIAHSMGGLIVRSALPHLEVYRYNMKSFISLGSPHLGYLYHNSNMIKWGLSLYNKYKKSSSLKFLLMDQQKDSRLSALYELTTFSGLNWFENVIVYAAKRDYYVNPQSALFQSNQIINMDFQNGKENAKIWTQMVKNINLLLQNVGVEKYLVHFHQLNEQEQNITDNWLGRKDHISLSNNKNFLKCLLIAHSTIFQKH